MICNVIETGDVVVFELEGEMDLYSASLLKTSFEKEREKGAMKYIVDCKKLTYLDSSGVGVLISIFTSAHRMKANLFLCEVHGTVKSVIEFTKLTGFLPIVATRKEAMDRISPESSIEEKVPATDERWILQDDKHKLLKREGMYHKDFHLDLKKVRYLSQIIVQKAPVEIRDFNLLEQQISELIKNAVRHGNKNDPNRKVSIYFRFNEKHAHIIVEDEGTGFRNIDEWNRFFAAKRLAFEQHDFEAMMKYVSFRTDESTEDDGGNALFAAVEFWNEGVVFNSSGNCIAVARKY
jgi:serine/threonine-protein kinase RsbW